MRAFCEDIGVTKTESLIDFGRLENAVRDHLNKVSPRYMAVLRPLKVIIDNWPAAPDGKPVVEMLDCVNNPENPAAGSRKVPFSGELLIERDDFMETPAKKFFRLTPGNEVRFRWAYFLKCVGCDKDSSGNVTAVHCTYDPATKGGDSPPGPNGEPGRKVKGTIHWVSAAHAAKAEVRLFDRLFKAEEPGKASGNFMDDFNSLEVIEAHLEPALDALKYSSDCAPGGGGFTPGTFCNPRVQFERLGYFTLDPDSSPTRQVWNRTVTLKDTWAKEATKQG
jgi:glutaminyl-tRNA synthetase